MNPLSLLRPRSALARRPALPARFLFTLTLALGALGFAGCVTDQQVKAIVRDSNYQMLLAAAPGVETGLATNPQDASAAAGNDDAAARINAFLEANKDDPALASALRLRQTLLYLNQRALALADATVADVKAPALHSVRDQALLAAYPDLRWWAEYSLAGEFAFYPAQKDAALAHIAALEQQAAAKPLAGAPDLRDYFLEMRAWIGLKLGLASTDAAFSIATLQNAVNAWLGTFSAAELALLNSADFKSTKPFDLSTRRVIRARALLTTLSARTTGAPNHALVFAQAAANTYYAGVGR
jgi:hypothetical protein